MLQGSVPSQELCNIMTDMCRARCTTDPRASAHDASCMVLKSQVHFGLSGACSWLLKSGVKFPAGDVPCFAGDCSLSPRGRAESFHDPVSCTIKPEPKVDESRGEARTAEVFSGSLKLSVGSVTLLRPSLAGLAQFSVDLFCYGCTRRDAA